MAPYGAQNLFPLQALPQRGAGAHDALPIPTWLPLLSKLLALMLVPVLLLTVLLCCGGLIQALKGYYHFELGLYLHELYGLRLVDSRLHPLSGAPPTRFFPPALAR
jgi:hypothetical protein